MGRPGWPGSVDRVLRVEVIVNNIEELCCGKRLDKLPGMLERL